MNIPVTVTPNGFVPRSQTGNPGEVVAITNSTGAMKQITLTPSDFWVQSSLTVEPGGPPGNAEIKSTAAGTGHMSTSSGGERQGTIQGDIVINPTG